MSLSTSTSPTVERRIEAMTSAAREHGVADAALARELACNAIQAIADDPTPVDTLAAMINHRRFHFAAFAAAFSGAPKRLAREMVRAYNDAG